MPYTPPSFDSLVAQLVALAQSRLQVSVGGVQGQPDLTEGSDVLTQIESMAFLADFYNQALAQFYADHDIDQATGDALALLLAPRGLKPVPAGYAIVPVLCSRNSASGANPSGPVVIPAAIPATPTTAGQAGYRFLAPDATGALNIAFQAMQSPYLPQGQAGVIPPGASATWVLALAEVAGSAGNVAAGAIRGMGSAVLAGLDTVGNPSVLSTAAPTAVAMGATGSATNQYAVVARGQQGRALPSAPGTVTNAAAILTSANYNLVAWQPVDNAAGYDVLTLVGATWMLLGSVPASQTSLTDTGQTPQAYSLPRVNDANYGAGGADQEGDAAFRRRAEATPTNGAGGAGGGGDAALIAAARGIAGVTAAFVTDSPQGGACTVSYVAQPNPLPPLLAQQLATAVDGASSAGAVATCQQLTPTLVAVAYTYVPTSNAPATLVSDLNAALAAYVAGLTPGAPIRDSAVAAAMQAVAGVQAITARTYAVTGGGTYTNGDVAGQAGILYALGPITVTTGG